MANKTVYTLDIDTKPLVNGYKAAIKQMEDAGVSSKITGKLTDQLTKLEQQYKSLALQGQAGFKTPKEIASYEQKVSKLMASFRTLETEMGNVGKSIKGVAEASSKAHEKLAKTFSNLGFESAVVQAQKLEKAENKTAAAEKMVKEEIEKRAKAVEDLKQKTKELEAQTAKTAKAGLGDIKGKNGPITEGAFRKKYRSDQDSEVAQNVTNFAAQAITMEKSFKDAWKRVEEYIESEGLGDVFSPGKQKVFKDQMEERFNASRQSAEELQETLGQLAEAEERVNQLGSIDSKGNIKISAEANNQLKDSIKGITEVEREEQAVMAKTNNDLNTFENTLNTVNNATNGVAGSAESAEEGIEKMTSTAREGAQKAEQLSESFNQLKQNALALFSINSVFNGIRNAIRQTYQDVKQLDKSFASIAMVTSKTLGDLWSSYGQYAKMAGELGQQTDSVVKASALFYQQGLDTEEALSLTANTMKLATLAGNDYQTATKEMTAALRGFKMEMDEGSRVMDVYSELAAHAAASVDDIAQAMSRTASIADSAGMSFENTSAFLTKMIETTQESAENIGTSLKTIIARFTELKENVAGTKDSEFEDLDLNKVDKALKSVGVSLKDTTGQFRDADDVLLELSKNWDTLDRNTQRYVATIAAGSRQQSRFIALMEDYDRTIELIDNAANSEGKADEQFAKYADTMEYKLNQLSTKWEEFRVGIASSDLFKSLIDQANNFVSMFTGALDSKVKTIGLIGSFVIMGRIAIKSFVKGISESGEIIKKGFSALSAKISNHKFHTKIDADITQAEEKVEQLKTEVESKRSDVEIDANIAETVKKIETLKTKIEKMKEDTESDPAEIKVNIENAETKIAKLEAKIKELEGEKGANAKLRANLASEQGTLEQLTKKKKVAYQQAGQQLGSALGMSLTMAVTAVITKQNPFEALGKSLLAMTVTILPQIISMIATMGAGMAAATAGLSLVLAALIPFTAALFTYEADTRTEAEKSLATHKELLENQEKLVAARKEEFKTASDNRKTYQDLLKDYDELVDKTIKTSEEEEKWKDVVTQIKDEYPDIISFYDEETNQLTIQRDLAQEKLDILKEEERIKNNNALTSELESVALEKSINQDKKDMLEDDRNNSDLSTKINTNSSDGKLETVFDYIIRLWKEEDNGISSAEQLANYFDEYTTIDLRKFFSDAGFNVDIASDAKKIEEYLKEEDVGLQKLQKLVNSHYDDEEDQNKLEEDKLKEKEKQVYADYYTRQGKSSYVANILAGETQANEIDKVLTEEQTKAFYAPMLNNVKGFWGPENVAIIENGRVKIDDDEEWSGDTFKSRGELEKKEFDYGGFKIRGEELFKKAQDLDDNFNEYYDAVRDDTDDKENITKTTQVMNDLQNAMIALRRERLDFYNNLSEEQQQIFDSALSSWQGMSISDFEQTGFDRDKYGLLMFGDKYKKDDENQNKIIDNLEQQQQDVVGQLTQTKDKIVEQVGSLIPVEDLEKMTQEELNNTETAIQGYIDRFGGETAEALGKQIKNIFSEHGDTKSSDITKAMTFDWEDVTFANYNEEKQKFINDFKDMFQGGAVEAAKVFEETFEATCQLDVSEMLGSDPETALDGLVENLTESMAKSVKTTGELKDAITSQLTDGVISFTEAQDVKAKLKEFGMDAQDYLNYNADGTISLATEDLKKALEDTTTYEDVLINQAREQVQEKITQLENQIALLKGEEASIEYNSKLIEAYGTQERQLKHIAQLTAIAHPELGIDANSLGDNVISTFSGLDESLKNKTIDVIEKQIAEWRKILNEDLAEGGEKYNELNAIAKSAEKENAKVFTDAEKSAAKARASEAKSADDLAKKMETLNDKLKEYNELLYGSPNRKSSLDVLYNYTEAINSFNDEISRSKDLLGNAKTTEEATAALQRYGAATHNVIAEETAKQKVLKAGLAEFEKKINDGFNYKDEETGKNINVDFSKYASKDPRTGKYLVDTKAIQQQGKFGDKIAELIEHQVSEYNKYYDDMLKSEDNVLKAEKEIQDLRKDALDKYTAMEKELADAMKAQYQEEVNAVKDKYDSMKDADDKYLDALQDAIEKQRQLRDSAKEYDDLAEKEKKLSLMQRDTSGSNQVDVLNLQKEVQEDRQQVLDNEVDRIIDGLQKLYENQEELRNTEVELKEALLDNELYWNKRAEQMALSFNTAGEYAQYLSSISKDFANSTSAEQQKKLSEYQETFSQASEGMALKAMDDTTATGDWITQQLEVKEDEIGKIIEHTSETLTTEAQRYYDETTQDFVNSLKKAVDAIKDARDSLNELAASGGSLGGGTGSNTSTGTGSNTSTSTGGYTSTLDDSASNNQSSSTPLKRNFSFLEWSALNQTIVKNPDKFSIKNGSNGDNAVAKIIDTLYKQYHKDDNNQVTRDRINKLYSGTFGTGSCVSTSKKLSTLKDLVAQYTDGTFKYETGGIVDYTGPAWVDGTKERPEAFLSAEDTERIGNAAKILSNITWLSPTTDNSTITNNNGDVSIEINLNVAQISSDTDIDDMLDKVKKEIVEIARPVGTTPILRQH